MRVLRIILKDLKILLSDKKVLAILMLMPILLTAILSSALKGAFATVGGSEKIEVAVVKNYDKTSEYNRFIDTLKNGFLMENMNGKAVEQLKNSAAEFDGEEIFFRDFMENEDIKKIISYRMETEDEALRLLRNKEISAVIVLPQGFVYDLYINMLTPFRNNIDIKVVGHPDKLIGSQVVQYIAEAFSDSVSSMVIGKNVVLETAMEYGLGYEILNEMDAAAERISKELAAIRVDVDNVEIAGRRPVSSFDYYAAAMMAMFVLFAAAQGGRTLLEEKHNATYRRMAAAGTSGLEILAGKFFTVFITALLQMAVMISYSSIILKVYWGSIGAVVLICLSTAFAVAGIGAFVSAATFKADNDKLANVFETAIIQTMALLGGSFFPVEILPAFMQKLSIFSVNGLALKSYLKVMMGYGTGEIVQYLVSLAAVGIAFAAAAALIFNGRGGDYYAKHHQAKASKAA